MFTSLFPPSHYFVNVIDPLLWFQEDRITETGNEANVRESTLFSHACFLIKSMSQREEHIRDISVNLLTQLRDKFPQVVLFGNAVCSGWFSLFLFLWSTTCLIFCGWNGNTYMQVLWNSSCLDSLLFSVHNNSPSAVINDPALKASVRSLYQRIVREWISISLSYAPCTSQGLLQVGYTIS